MTTLYDTLGVRPEASSQEIKSAFRSLALRYHPDRCKDANAKEMFIAVRAAYELLANAERRAEYDRILARHTQRAPGATHVPRDQETGSGPFERWQADARYKAEQEARLSYADFVNTALVSALKLGGDIVVALGQGALLGVLSAILRALAGLSLALPIGAVFLSLAVHPALVLLTMPLGVAWAVWLIRQRSTERWTSTSVAMFVGGLAAYCAICAALFSGMLRKSAAERAEQKAHFELTSAISAHTYRITRAHFRSLQ